MQIITRFIYPIKRISKLNKSSDTFGSKIFVEGFCKLDHTPFGVTLTNRNYTSSSYRYGFNGMEKDDEVKGVNNSYDFGARLYDNRLGRWLSVDPLSAKMPFHSTYSANGNNPINYFDLGGEIIEWANDEKSQELKSRTLELVSSSKLFAAVYYYLDGLQDVIKVKADDKYVQERLQINTGGSSAFAGGFARPSTNEMFLSEIYADESTFSEEFFHIYQALVYENSPENQPNHDAEAKVFNQAVALEKTGRELMDESGSDGCDATVLESVAYSLDNAKPGTDDFSPQLMENGVTIFIFTELVDEKDNTTLEIKQNSKASNEFKSWLVLFKSSHAEENDPYSKNNNTNAEPKAINAAVKKVEE